MRRIYIGAPWDSRHLAKEAAEKLEAAGHEITHAWWKYDFGESGDISTHKACAIADIYGVTDADVLFLMNLQERGKETSGKAVEMGIALTLKRQGTPIRIFATGIKYTNIFQYLDEVEWVESVEEAIEKLKG